ncbi:MAG: biopolymer transporter ExbD [Planctomycetota bacterium]
MAIKLPRDEQTTINLTPLIDIVFLLVIFFMVGSRFSELNEAEKQIPLQVPQVADGRAMTDPPRKRVINVLHDGTIFLDQQEHTLEELYSEMVDATEQYRQIGVVVRADANSPYQNVADVIATCRNAEISDLNISVKTLQR